MKRGRLVVVDGGEGSGKSTLLDLAGNKFSPDKAMFTREPGGSPFAEDIRSMIFSERGKEANALTHAGLFWAARADHLAKVVRPALERGMHVISDRMDSSTFAYQIRGEENSRLASIFNQMREVYMEGIHPFYILLDIDPSVGLGRKRGETGTNYFDERELSFHGRVRDGLLEFVSLHPHRVIDASRPLKIVAKEFFGVLDIILAWGTPPK